MLAILIAAGGFTVLTASSAASRLQTVGTVNAHALPAYDVLVRPKGARSALEQSQGLVQPGFLTGIYGGITLDQWRKIKALPGINVAAPVAMVGYVVPLVYLPINMRPALPTSGDGVARMDVTWSFDNGLSREQQSPDFAYLTTKSLPLNGGLVGVGGGSFVQKAPAICPPTLMPPTATLSTRPSTINCFSRTKGGASMFGLVGQEVSFPLPVVVAAVDPAEENKLDGLNGAVTSGASLTGASLTDPRSKGGQVVPVLAGDTPATGVSATVTVSRVAGSAVSLVQGGAAAGALGGQLREKVSESTFTAAQAYRVLLQYLKDSNPDNRARGDSGRAGLIFDYATVSLPQFAGGPVLTPTGQSDPTRPADGEPDLTPGFADRHLRSITQVRLEHPPPQ